MKFHSPRFIFPTPSQLLTALALCLLFFAKTTAALTIPPDKAKEIGVKIWNNECGGTMHGLSTWNDGEEFASMGIGHFIWYPKGYKGCYDEQFPKLLAFLEANGVTLPHWLTKCKGCPWSCRKAFLQDTQRQKLIELRTLLISTLDLQVVFMTKRLEAALPKMTANLPKETAWHLRKQFYRVAREPNGIYALLDYINFKGEGTSLQERYKGEGWGLLQVFEQMPDPAKSGVMNDFVTCAKAVLIRRIANAPQQRQEDRWIKGWINRLDTYN